MTPLWLQILQAFSVLCISGVGACLAWQQVQIARVKLQHDLYDRRYRVFDAVRTLLAEVTTHANPPEDAISAFVRGTDDAVFLFDADLVAYLSEIRQRALRLRGINNTLDLLQPGTAQRASAVTTASEHSLWLTEQLDCSVAKFSPFLKLDRRRRWWRLSF
jgi:hypothetical protein